MWSDPVADMLTRIRNALQIRREYVDVPNSKMKRRITEILKEEGFILNFVHIDDGKQGILRVYLKYDENGEPVIKMLKKVSKPGRRIYVSKTEIPKPFGGTGIAIISTSRGIFQDRIARKMGIGGEIVCEVW